MNRKFLATVGIVIAAMQTFTNPTVGEAVLLRTAMQSEGFVSGSQGWRLERNGNAELNNLVVRGTLIAGTNVNNGQLIINDPAYPGEIIFPFGDFPAVTTPARIGIDEFGLWYFENGEDGVGGFPPIELANTGGWISNRMGSITVADNSAAVTNSTSYTGVTGGNTMILTMTYPPSGIVLVHISANLANSIANTNTLTSFEMRDTNGVGTLRVAASDVNSILFQPPINNGQIASGRTIRVSGLPTSGTMWVQMQHRVSANTGTFNWRKLIVEPQP